MSKVELRIKLLISGLLLLTALLIIVLTYLTPLIPAALEKTQLSKHVEDQDILNKTESYRAEPYKTESDTLSKNNIKETIEENTTLASLKTKAIVSSKKENKVFYFIIDDAGYNIEKLKPFLDFPGDITIAVLPGLQYSRQCAELALKKGKKVILHQPMESINNRDTGPHAIMSEMQENEIINILEHNISSIPGIIGMNNHMGSAITADEKIINIIFKYLYNKNLFFIDSMTTHDSICKKVAADSGYTIMHRDVFLDNINERKAILESINIGKAIAQNKGYAVMIGHVWSSELANTLIQIYPTLVEEGFTIKDLSSFPTGESYFASIGN